MVGIAVVWIVWDGMEMFTVAAEEKISVTPYGGLGLAGGHEEGKGKREGQAAQQLHERDGR